MSNTFFNLLIVHDPSKSMKKITPFLGINVTEREINQIAWKPSFREMKTDAAKDNCGPNKTICALPWNRSLALRKGKSEKGAVPCLGLIFGSSSILLFNPCFPQVHPILHNRGQVVIHQWMFMKWNSWTVFFPDFLRFPCPVRNQLREKHRCQTDRNDKVIWRMCLRSADQCVC